MYWGGGKGQAGKHTRELCAHPCLHVSGTGRPGRLGWGRDNLGCVRGRGRGPGSWEPAAASCLEARRGRRLPPSAAGWGPGNTPPPELVPPKSLAPASRPCPQYLHSHLASSWDASRSRQANTGQRPDLHAPAGGRGPVWGQEGRAPKVPSALGGARQMDLGSGGLGRGLCASAGSWDTVGCRLPTWNMAPPASDTQAQEGQTDSGQSGAGQRAPGPQSPRAAGHRARLRQAWQRGRMGRQVCWPKPTSRPLISLHSSLWGWESSVWREGGSPPEGAHPSPPWGWAHLGSHSSRALRVSSGDLVAFLVHLSRLAILCTCVSTAAWKRGRVSTRQAYWARLPIPAPGSQCGWVGGPRGPSPDPPSF